MKLNGKLIYYILVHIIIIILHFIMGEDNNLTKILNEVDKLDNLFKIINTNIDYIKGCKDQIEYNHGVKLDDIKFYTSIIHNCSHYYKSNITIRLNKLSKDLKNHYSILGTSDYIGDICFNKDIIKKMYDSYLKKKYMEKEAATRSANECFWIKDVFYDELEEWSKQLYVLLLYHRVLLEPLKKASDEEKKFFMEKKVKSNNLAKNCDIEILAKSYNIEAKKPGKKVLFSKKNNSVKNEDILNLEQELNNRDMEIMRLNEIISNNNLDLSLLNEQNDNLNKELANKDYEIEELNKKLTNNYDEIEQLNIILDNLKSENLTMKMVDENVESENVQNVESENVQNVESENIQNVESENVQNVESENVQNVESENVQNVESENIESENKN